MNVHRCHCASTWSDELVLHLHRLKDQNRLTNGNALVRFNEDANDQSRDGSFDPPIATHWSRYSRFEVTYL